MTRKPFLTLAFFIPMLIFAQSTASGDKSIRDFFNYIEKYIPKEKNSLSKIKQIPDTTLTSIKNVYYNAITISPYSFKSKIKELTSEWEKSGIKSVKPPSGIKPAVRISLMKDKLIEKYGEEYVKILSTPIILKVSVTDIKKSIYTSASNNKITAGQTNLVVKIEEILKGKDYFKKGELITISYLDWWYQDKPISFEKGKLYILPVEPWYDKNDNFNSLIIKDPLASHSIVQIDGVKLSTIYPETAEIKVSWTKFKENFIEKYIEN
jgi:anaerobic ribonucleoside-triphosphate reductase